MGQVRGECRWVQLYFDDISDKASSIALSAKKYRTADDILKLSTPTISTNADQIFVWIWQTSTRTASGYLGKVPPRPKILT